MRELCDVADTEHIDLIIVAGDIYDSTNPPAEAERLFYRYTKALAKDGTRPVLIMAGNHDSPERIIAPSPFACETGVFICGLPSDSVPTGEFDGFAGIIVGKVEDNERNQMSKV